MVNCKIHCLVEKTVGWKRCDVQIRWQWLNSVCPILRRVNISLINPGFSLVDPFPKKSKTNQSDEKMKHLNELI